MSFFFYVGGADRRPTARAWKDYLEGYGLNCQYRCVHASLTVVIFFCLG